MCGSRKAEDLKAKKHEVSLRMPDVNCICRYISLQKRFFLEKKAMSIIDLSKQLQISPSTISIILNGKAKEKRISDDTAQRVLDYVKKVGYKPNQLAKSFRTGKTHIIGLMVEDISNPFFANIAKLIEERAYLSGYKILYCSHENDPKKAAEQMQLFKDRYVDGYIITPAEGVKEDIDRLVESGKPVILFDRCFEESHHDYVILDNYQSAYDAVTHLKEHGYDEIAFITINSLQSQMKERLRGYETAASDYGFSHYIKEVDYYMDDGTFAAHITDFLKRKKKINAVIFATNYLGVSGLKAIRQMKMNVASDIGVLCFDDNTAFELATPAITSIAQPIEDMSVQLITILLDKLAKKNTVMHKVTLPGRLVIRESTIRK